MHINEKEICSVYISKINSNCEKQIILLMIPNWERQGWNYLAAKKVSALLHGITSKHKGDLNCLNSFRKLENKIKLNFMSKYLEIKIFVELKCH